MKSQQCAPLKHHYDECAERVMQQQEETGKAEEDCVEECTLKPVSECYQRSLRLLVCNKRRYDHLLTLTSLPPHALRLRLRRS
jgi:hypothetical protein